MIAIIINTKLIFRLNLSRAIACLLLFSALKTSLLMSYETIPKQIINATIHMDNDNRPTRIIGNSIFSRSIAKNKCISLNYNNNQSDNIHLHLFFSKFVRKPKTFRGNTKITHDKNKFDLTEIRNGIYKISNIKSENIDIEFSSKIPMNAFSKSKEYFFDNFYPILIEDCNFTSKSFRHKTVYFDAEIKIPSGWHTAGPVSAKRKNYHRFNIKSNRLSFAISKEWNVHKFLYKNILYKLFYYNDYKNLKETVIRSVESHKILFGPMPFKNLSIAETSEIQNSSSPGLLTYNVPRQKLFSSLQNDILNWKHWIIGSLTASQWYGTSLGVIDKKDEWLIQGFIDFATGEFLYKSPRRQNLFNSYDKNFEFITFNYRQAQEVIASILYRNTPENYIDSKNKIYQDINYSPYAFVKHALALRHLKSWIGEEQFIKMLKTYTQDNLFKRISSKNFLASFFKDIKNNARRKELSSTIKMWWEEKNWSDFSIGEFKKKKLSQKKWLAQAKIIQNGDIASSVQVGFYSKNKSHLITMAHPKKSQPFNASAITSFEPTYVVVDPYHEIYDYNRFNNSSNWPDIQFFPGNAKTFSDNSYTTLWVPYVFRRPGEFSSIAIQAAIFRYIENNLFLKLENSPAANATSYEINQNNHFSHYGIQTNLSLVKSYNNQQIVSASVNKSILDNNFVHVNIEGKVNNKINFDTKDSQHNSYSIRSITSINKKYKSNLRYRLVNSVEHAPYSNKKLFLYNKYNNALNLNYRDQMDIDVSSRVFFGAVFYKGNIPNEELYKPNDLANAGIRIDKYKLGFVDKIYSIKTDISFPFHAPLPNDTLILNRNLKFKFFYDIGKGLNFNQNSSYQSAGYGVDLPFGGDIIGQGTLTISKFSILSIVYSKVNNNEFIDPANFLFSFSGEI